MDENKIDENKPDENKPDENKIEESNMKENNVKQDNSNSLKKKNTIIAILLVIILALSLVIVYMLISKPTAKNENGNETKENESKEKDKEEKEEEIKKEKDFYIIYYKEGCLYGIKEDASTKALTCNVINKFTTYDTYDNNLYYIDQDNYAHELDLHTLKDTNLNIKTSEEYNWNLYAGKGYFVLTEIKIANKYNLKDGKVELLPIKSVNKIYIDSDDNLYYTGEGNTLYCYNINTKESTVVADDGRVIEGTGNLLIYASGPSAGEETLYLYNTKTKQSTIYNSVDLNSNFFRENTLIYNEKFVAIDKKDIVVLTDNKKEVIASFDNIDRIASIHLLNDKILVNTAIDDYSVCEHSTDCICGPEITYTSYLVDINTKEVKKLDKEYGFLTEYGIYINV